MALTWLTRGALLLAACGTNETVLRPVIDTPGEGDDALASPLDEITLTIAHAGSTSALRSQAFKHGEPLEMPDVPFGDDLVLHMAGSDRGSQVAYGRTCAISLEAGVQPPTPHLFFSRTVRFATLGVAPTPRFGGLGVSYLGAALLLGGNDGRPDHAITDVEKFDPLSGELTMLGSLTPRDQVVQAQIGTLPPRVVVIGGTLSGVGAKFFEVVDAGRIEQFDSAEMARVNLTATSLTDGRVVVIGGNPPEGLPSGEIDLIADRDGTLEVRKLNAELVHKRSGHSATRLGEDVGAPVLVAGGIDEMGLLVGVAELFKPLNEALADPMKFNPPMVIPRRGHVAMLMPDSSVLIIGGIDALGLPVRQLERFSVDEGFTPLGELPAGAGTTDFTATTLPDGRILLIGGRLTPSSPPLDSAYIATLNPLDGLVSVVATDHLTFSRAGHQAVALCDGTILITGGTGGQFPAERYNPPPAGRR